MVLLELLGVALGAAAISGIANAGKEKPKPKTIAGGRVRECPNCGTMVNKKAVRCINCNYHFKKGKVVPKNKQSTNQSKPNDKKNSTQRTQKHTNTTTNDQKRKKSNKNYNINNGKGIHMKIPGLVIGRSYSNDDLMNMFKCANAGGMRRSKRTNTLVLVYDHNKMYDDAWKGNVLHYTGMGLYGNQKLKGTQNKTLYESNTNGVDVHLFEVFYKGRYEYQGQVKLAGKPYQEVQRDANGRNRKVWMFPLKRK